MYVCQKLTDGPSEAVFPLKKPANQSSKHFQVTWHMPVGWARVGPKGRSRWAPVVLMSFGAGRYLGRCRDEGAAAAVERHVRLQGGRRWEKPQRSSVLKAFVMLGRSCSKGVWFLSAFRFYNIIITCNILQPFADPVLSLKTY